MNIKDTPRTYLVFQRYHSVHTLPEYTTRGPFGSKAEAQGFANGFTQGASVSLVGVFSTWQRARKCIQRHCEMDQAGTAWEKHVAYESRAIAVREQTLERHLEEHVFVWNIHHVYESPLSPDEVTDILVVPD